MSQEPTPPAGPVSAGGAPVVVTGDVVTSRRFVDLEGLLAGLEDALAGVEAAEPGVHALHRTERDVFRGVYGDLGVALTAALRLRLATDGLVLPTVDGVDEPVELRLGIGVGTGPEGTDSPASSALRAATERARQALAAAERLPMSRTWPDSLRSRCAAADPTLAAAVNAHLLLQDQLLARLDARDRRALLGLLDGERQVDIAAALGVTQPAIARRIRVRGSLALHRAVEELRLATRPSDTAPPAI
ncbi:MAG: hypothetical protein EA340_11305 [Nitriliruptor sp.]|nr:MAG: hypothetical protein EA340_11305 [Nitriliruptor sp.]